MLETKFGGTVRVAAMATMATFMGIAAAQAAEVLPAPSIDHEIVLDGNIDDWAAVPGTTVALQGDGGVDSVEIKWAVRGDRIYMLAVWADSTENILHKPYKWDEAEKAYTKTKEKEDRFAISLAMSGDFTANKMAGQPFEADVWHWKASRSNPAGIAHDKWWKVALEPFEKGEEVTMENGQTLYMGRISDKGDKLYKSVKYDTKQEDVMPRYEVNTNAQGSIADIKAKGVWRDGHWYLEISRALNTGHADDAVVPANGEIQIALAAFNNVDGESHSVSDALVLRTGAVVN